tara:strand:- start:125131 stop:125265 length:135 start_codon:yes stop_codon:yes gene_type:complete
LMMYPVVSAMGIKRSGAMVPYTGSNQRISASKPSTCRVSILTLG